LQRWDAFRNQFEELDVSMVAVSPDTAAEAAAMKRRYGLGMGLLSDESLAVTRLYGIEHQKAFAVAPGRSIVRSLAVPTTILVDASGIVRWIDQSDDYRIRSDADRVLAAVRRELA
jgi:peroxiredoxin